MSEGVEPINSGPEAGPAAESASEGLSGTAADAKESEAKIAGETAMFGVFCGFCLSNVLSLIWRTSPFPKLHLLAYVNAGLTVLFCLGIYLLLKRLKRMSRPLPWLKGWVIGAGLFITIFLALAVLSPLPRVLGEQLVPWPQPVNYPDEAGFILQLERVVSAWDQLENLDSNWAVLCGFAFLLAAYYFKALPVIRPPEPPPPPPVPRDEWWKKYY